LHLCESVGKRLRKNNYAATVLSVGIRNNKFEYYSKQRKLCIPTDNTTQLYKYTASIFKEGWQRDPIRQLGIRADKLIDSEFTQLSIFDDGEVDKQKKLDHAIDKVRRRFGDNAIMRASFLCDETKKSHKLDKFSPFRATGGL